MELIMDKMSKHYGKILKKIRKERNLTQGELAVLLGQYTQEYIHPNYISRWELMNFPPLEVMVNLCGLYGIDICEILYEGQDFDLYGLTTEAKEIVSLIKNLSPDAQKMLLEFVKNMLPKTKGE